MVHLRGAKSVALNFKLLYSLVEIKRTHTYEGRSMYDEIIASSILNVVPQCTRPYRPGS